MFENGRCLLNVNPKDEWKGRQTKVLGSKAFFYNQCQQICPEYYMWKKRLIIEQNTLHIVILPSTLTCLSEHTSRIFWKKSFVKRRHYRRSKVVIKKITSIIHSLNVWQMWLISSRGTFKEAAVLCFKLFQPKDESTMLLFSWISKY